VPIGAVSGAWQFEQYCAVSSLTAPHFVQYLLIKISDIFVTGLTVTQPGTEIPKARYLG